MPTEAPTPAQAALAREAFEEANDLAPVDAEPEAIGLRLSWDDPDSDAPPLQLVLLTKQVGPADDLLCRQTIGFPLTFFLNADALAIDGATALWWFAKRKNGHPKYSWSQACAFVENAEKLQRCMDVELVTAADLGDPTNGSADGSL